MCRLHCLGRLPGSGACDAVPSGDEIACITADNCRCSGRRSQRGPNEQARGLGGGGDGDCDGSRGGDADGLRAELSARVGIVGVIYRSGGGNTVGCDGHDLLPLFVTYWIM